MPGAASAAVAEVEGPSVIAAADSEGPIAAVVEGGATARSPGLWPAAIRCALVRSDSSYAHWWRIRRRALSAATIASMDAWSSVVCLAVKEATFCGGASMVPSGSGGGLSAAAVSGVAGVALELLVLRDWERSGVGDGSLEQVTCALRGTCMIIELLRNSLLYDSYVQY